MEVIVRKLTDETLMRRACEMTMRGQKSKASLAKMYQCEHSPIRTQLFWIELHGIPTFVSVHLRTHKVGCQQFDEDEHFVMSNREDRGGDDKVDRWTPVNHALLVNAQSLINMARRRLCLQAHEEARKVMLTIRQEVAKVDPDLAVHMVPECEYRGGVCHELKPCGRRL